MSDIQFVKNVVALIKQDKKHPTKRQLNNILDQVVQLTAAYDVAQDGLNHARELLTQKAETIEELRYRVKVLESAPLMGVVKSLEEQLAAMTADRNQWKADLEILKGKYHEAVGTSAENAIKYVKVRDQLAAVEKERDALSDQIAKDNVLLQKYMVELAEYQVRKKK